MAEYDVTSEILTRKITLQLGQETLVDAEDYRWLRLFKWRLYGTAPHFYCSTRIPATGKVVPMHRLVSDAKPGQLVDHRNGQGLDNRKTNLRIATTAQNMANRRPYKGTSRYKGVTWDRTYGFWKASIRVEGKTRHLGTFTNEEDAAIAYNEAAKDVFSDFAWLNPVEVVEPLEVGRKGKGGRPQKPWFRKQTDAWYVTIKGRQYRLAKGLNNQEEAIKRFERLLILVMQNDTETVQTPAT